MNLKYTFPDGFEWGTVTASYQIEGASHEDGRGESIWDRFSHTPGRILDHTTGDVACDFYHRYEEDIQLLKQMGTQVFRLSISWPRIFPDGTGEPNTKGIEFYRNVLTCLKKNGIKSSVTLYHWDLPQKLQDRGGWANRDIVDWFVQYCNILFYELGDLVDYWITLNEPYCTCFLGYWSGVHAPGYHDYTAALQATHNILLAHGSVIKAYRATSLPGEIGVTLNMNMCYPLRPDHPEDIKAAKLSQMQQNCLYGDPIMKGTYPEEFFEYLTSAGIKLPEILDGDMEQIHQELDFFGLNTYYPEHVKADPDNWPLGVKTVLTDLPLTAMDWEVDASSMYDLLMWINKRYAPKKIIITENGMANNDWVNSEGMVEDSNRVDYLKRYLTVLHKAIQNEIPVAGYYAWSYCDNFEWAFGLSRRFGLVYIDYKTLQRIPKKSYYWFSDVIRHNGF